MSEAASAPSLQEIINSGFVLIGSIAAWFLVRSVVNKKILDRIELYNAGLCQWAMHTDIFNRLSLLVPVVIIRLFSAVFPDSVDIAWPLIAGLTNLLVILVLLTLTFSLRDLLAVLNLPEPLKKTDILHLLTIAGSTVGWGLTIIFGIQCYLSSIAMITNPSWALRLGGGAVCAIAIFATALWVRRRQNDVGDFQASIGPAHLRQSRRGGAATGSFDEIRIMDVVLTENTILLDQIVKQGADINERTRDGQVPLIEAIKHNLVDMVDALLEKGCKTELQDKKGWTPLTLAAFSGQTETVRKLIKKKADVNAPSGHGWTPLIWALHSGHGEIEQILCKQGAPAEQSDRYVWTKFPDRTAILDFLLQLYRLQIGAPPDSQQRFFPTSFSADATDISYRLEVKVDDKWLSRIVSLSMLGEGSGAKSRCYKVIFDTIWVVKLPPTPITKFETYIKAIKAERETVNQLSDHFVCIAPGLSDILKKVPGFTLSQKADQIAAEKMAAAWLGENPGFQKYLKIGKAFAFFMDISQYTFLSQYIEKFHNQDLAAKITSEMTMQTQLISDLIGLEAAYGEDKTSLFHELVDCCFQFESGVTRLSKEHPADRQIAPHEMRNWLVTHIFQQPQNIAKQGFSQELTGGINGLLESLAKQHEESWNAYRELVMSELTAKTFNQNTAQMAGVIKNFLLLLVKLKERGISMRDLKPDNLFIVEEEADFSLGIIDFETAVHIKDGGQTFTQPFLGGTPPFATPSHLLTNQDLHEIFGDIAPIYYYQDWYAVIGMIYTTVTGEKLLFKQTARELIRIIKEIRANRKNQSKLIRCFKSESNCFWQRVWQEFDQKTKEAADRLRAVTLLLPEDVRILLLENYQIQHKAHRQAVKAFIKQEAPLRGRENYQKLKHASIRKLNKMRSSWEDKTSGPDVKQDQRDKAVAFFNRLIRLKRQYEKMSDQIKMVETANIKLDAKTVMEILLICVYNGMYHIEWEKTAGLPKKEKAQKKTTPPTEKNGTVPINDTTVGITLASD